MSSVKRSLLSSAIFGTGLLIGACGGSAEEASTSPETTAVDESPQQAEPTAQDENVGTASEDLVRRGFRRGGWGWGRRGWDYGVGGFGRWHGFGPTIRWHRSLNRELVCTTNGWIGTDCNFQSSTFACVPGLGCFARDLF